MQKSARAIRGQARPPVAMAEIWRGGFLESAHLGHAAVASAQGGVVEAWGDADLVILPRSSVKMIQALPLAENGAADRLGPAELALACASHQGADIHTARVRAWLGREGIGTDALRCGPQPPGDRAACEALIREGRGAEALHNNCSGKHAGFLTLARLLGADGDYLDPSHPVQAAVRGALEDVAGEASPGHAIDGCSAPNFALTLGGLARAMARFAAARQDGAGVRDRAAARLVAAMRAHPEMVAGEGRACTALIRAATGGTVVKTGAEGVYTAILPERGLGVAVKVADGAARAAETAIGALLVHLGALDPGHPEARDRLDRPIVNWAGTATGAIRPAAGFPA